MDFSWTNKLVADGILALNGQDGEFASIQTDCREYVAFPTKEQRTVLDQPTIIIPLSKSWVQDENADLDAFRVRCIGNGLAVWCDGDHYHKTDYQPA